MVSRCAPPPRLISLRFEVIMCPWVTPPAGEAGAAGSKGCLRFKEDERLVKSIENVAIELEKLKVGQVLRKEMHENMNTKKSSQEKGLWLIGRLQALVTLCSSGTSMMANIICKLSYLSLWDNFFRKLFVMTDDSIKKLPTNSALYLPPGISRSLIKYNNWLD